MLLWCNKYTNINIDKSSNKKCLWYYNRITSITNCTVLNKNIKVHIIGIRQYVYLVLRCKISNGYVG